MIGIISSKSRLVRLWQLQGLLAGSVSVLLAMPGCSSTTPIGLGAGATVNASAAMPTGAVSAMMQKVGMDFAGAQRNFDSVANAPRPALTADQQQNMKPEFVASATRNSSGDSARQQRIQQRQLREQQAANREQQQRDAMIANAHTMGQTEYDEDPATENQDRVDNDTCGPSDEELADASNRPFTVQGNTIRMKAKAKDAFVHIMGKDWYIFSEGDWFRVTDLSSGDQTPVRFFGNCLDNTITVTADDNSVMWKVEIYGRAGNDRITLDGSHGGFLRWSVIHGDAGDDILMAKGVATIIYGDSGNDAISGSEFDDTIYGGSGSDTIMGNAGNDVIFGGSDYDCIHGGLGSDTIEGGSGGDYIGGDEEYDCIHGQSGNDTIDGGDGGDYIGGGSGDDILHGDNLNEGGPSLHPGNDTIDGGHGNDYITGDEGDDIIHACGSNNITCTPDERATILGGPGNDYIFDDGKTAFIDGGPGQDTMEVHSNSTVADNDNNDDIRRA